jgi:P4 family phage/plasmid primase-like protien
MNLKTEIQEYTARGWSLFPCVGKVPAVQNGFKAATRDTAHAIALFSTIKNHNVAIATGEASGFFVLDVDVKNGQPGEESLSDLQDQYGKLPETVEVHTQSGGRHLYFKHVPGIGCKIGFRPGLDIKGSGGYVVCPPSTGYTWEASSDPATTPIAEAPEWLINLIKAPASVQSPSAGQDNEKFAAGARNNTLHRRGTAMRKMGLPYETILQGLNDLNRSKCEPPLPEHEVETIAKSVSKYEVGKEPGRPLEKVDFSKRVYDEIWNADLFHELNADDVRFCSKMKVWYFWGGNVWGPDEKLAIRYRGRQVVERMYQMAKEANDGELYKHAKKSATNNQIKAFLEIASSHPEISVRADDFDHTRDLWNCSNGSVNLLTGEIKPHDRKLLITKIANAPYIPGTPCPTWLKVLNMAFCGHKDTVDWFHRAVGYAISGSMEEQMMFILHGPGMNGKSTILKTLVRIFGSYAQNATPDTFLEQQGNRILNDIARLKGARFVTTSETPEGKKLSESRVKQLTSDDPITARFLFSEEFDFIPTGKIFMATNHIPRLSGTDKGIKRRLKLVPFKHIISDEEKDPKLDAKLQAEDVGIMAWVIEGNRLWREQGVGTCQDVKEYTEEFFEDSDYIGQYLNESCVVGRSFQVKAELIWKDFCEWGERNGITHPSRMKFIEYLKSKGLTKSHATSGVDKARIVWHGIGLKCEIEAVETCGRPW